MICSVIFVSTIHTTVSMPGNIYLIHLDSLRDNSRYLYIPHSLLILGSIIVTKRYLVLSFISVFCFFTISIVEFSYFKREKANFQSMIHFSDYKDIFLFNNPFGPFRDNWLFHLRKKNHMILEPERIKAADLKNVVAENAQTVNFENKLQILLKNEGDSYSSEISLNSPVICNNTRDLALEAKLSTTRPIKILTVVKSSMSDKNPEVEAVRNFTWNTKNTLLQVAFPYSETKNNVAFIIERYPHSNEVKNNQINIVEIEDLKFYCLP